MHGVRLVRTLVAHGALPVSLVLVDDEVPVVLLIDAEGARLPEGPRVRGGQMEPRKAGSGRSLSDKERRELARFDRQTALSLRYLMLAGRQGGMNAHEME